MKNIEEKFQLMHKNYLISITARNYNEHKFFISSNGSVHEVCMTTTGMRELAKHLLETADAIDNDPDFNHKRTEQ
jgi:hypothetical protein